MVTSRRAARTPTMFNLINFGDDLSIDDGFSQITLTRLRRYISYTDGYERKLRAQRRTTRARLVIDSLHGLRVFLSVSGCGSMTIAAKRLGLTQSAVSQSIRHLEQTLGTLLIDRGGRPLKPTAAGMMLQNRAAALIEDASALAVVVRQASATKAHELRIGIIDSFASTVGPSLIRALLPIVTRLSFRSGLAHDHAEGLLTRNLDVIISSDAMDDVDGLDRYPILSEPFLLILPEKLAATVSNPALKTLATTQSLIRFSARSLIGAQIERHLRRLGVRFPLLLEVDATDTLFAIVAEGLGWGIATPLCVLQARSRTDAIRILPFPSPGFVRQIHLLSRAGELGTLPEQIARLAREAFLRECAPELDRLLPWLRGQIAMGDS